MSSIINTKNWRWFSLSSNGFVIENSKNVCSEDAEIIKGNDIPYVTRTEFNNGVKHFVEKPKRFEKGNCITVGGEGANVFYQPIDFITGNNITKIYHKNMTENSALFIVSLLNIEKYRYSYNRAFNRKNVENTKIKLPSTGDGNIDWLFMENYIKELRERERENSQLAEKFNESSTITTKLNITNWKKINIHELFFVHGSKTTDPELINENKDLKFNYVTTKNQNNGVEAKSDFWTEKGGCITIDSATMGAVFYQEQNFIASDHVEILRPKFLSINKHIMLFFVTLLKLEQVKYGYGRKWNQKKYIKNISMYTSW